MSTDNARPNPKILIAFSDAQGYVLGNAWTVAAKETGFYLEAFDRKGDVAHASLHGPNDRMPSHRFHIKVDRKLAERRVANGELFVTADIPDEGQIIPGRTVGDRAYLVARIRWTWNLGRDKYRECASGAPVPKVEAHHTAMTLKGPLEPNSAWDIDIVASFNEPFWPDAPVTERNNSRIGPLHDGKSMYLTATSYKRFENMYPAPTELTPRLPRRNEVANRILYGGLDESGFYWFRETIAARGDLESNQQASRRLP